MVVCRERGTSTRIDFRDPRAMIMANFDLSNNSGRAFVVLRAGCIEAKSDR